MPIVEGLLNMVQVVSVDLGLDVVIVEVVANVFVRIV